MANKLAPVTLVVTFKSLITLPVKLKLPVLTAVVALTFAVVTILFDKLMPPALDEIVCVPMYKELPDKYKSLHAWTELPKSYVWSNDGIKLPKTSPPLTIARFPTVAVLPTLAIPVVNKLPPVTVPVALTIPAVNTLPPVTLPVALAVPPVAKLPPVTVPVADTTPAVNTLPPVMLPVALAVPPVAKLPPVTVPVADINPPVVKFAPSMLPRTVNKLPDVGSYVMPASAVKMSPGPLNCTSYVLPAASMLPVILA